MAYPHCVEDLPRTPRGSRSPQHRPNLRGTGCDRRWGRGAHQGWPGRHAARRKRCSIPPGHANATTCTGSSPAQVKVWAVPRGTQAKSPAWAGRRSSSRWNSRRPERTKHPSSTASCRWRTGPEDQPGRMNSQTLIAPPESSARTLQGSIAFSRRVSPAGSKYDGDNLVMPLTVADENTLLPGH